MVAPSAQRVVIIGSGLGGLAAAATLAARGYAVTVYESSPWLGGKACVLEQAGYRFDMGPTILTVPTVLERIWKEAGRTLADDLELVNLDPQWRCFFTDGNTLDLHQNVDAMTQTLGAFAPGSAPGYRRFIELSERLHEISNRFFFWRNVGSIWDIFDWRGSLSPEVLGDVLKMRMGSSVAKTVRDFVPDTRVAQMLDHFVQYVGSSPDASPAILCSIAHMQTHGGVWYPKGGTRAVPEALIKLGRSLGVEYHTETGIDKIELDPRNRVAAVRTNRGVRVPCDTVVSNMDSVRTHRELLGGEAKSTKKFNKRRSYEPACSGVVLYLGLDRAYDHLLHHNFIFSADPHQEFHDIYDRGEPAADPTCYVAAPARTEPGVAPPGGEALYVLVHTPYLRPHHDWSKMLPAYREVILDKLATTGKMTDIRERIRTQVYLTPQTIHERYRVLNGAIYGLASHGKYLGAFKPANRSPDVPGLYFAGGAAHPGPGMPMVMMSGWIAADTLDKDRAASHMKATV